METYKTKIPLSIIITFLMAIIAIKSNGQCTNCDGTTTGNNGSAIGYQTTATGQHSFASGYQSQALGNISTALGYKSLSEDLRSFSLGFYAESKRTSSFAIGNYVTSNSNFGFVIGTGEGSGANERLVNTVNNSLMIGLGSTKPTFFVSGSPAYNLTGRIGIGNVTDPKAKLHIKADNGENVDLMLEPGGSSKYATIKFGETLPNTSPNRITAKPSGDLDFYSGSDFVFNVGAVGIGVTDPAEKLEVAGTVKSTGLMLDNGTQATGRILQSDATGLASWVDPMSLAVDDGDWTVTQAGNLVNANSGKVGIGVAIPGEKLEVGGTIKSTGLVLADGTQSTGRILQSDANGNASWVDMPPSGDDDWTISGNNIWRQSGNVGIGINPQQHKLDVAGSLRVNDAIYGNTSGPSSKLTIMGSNNANAAKIELWKGANPGERALKLATFQDGDIEFRTDGFIRMNIKGGAQQEIVIGQPYGSEHYVDLKVNGKVWAQEVEVMSGWWPDKVFDKEYKLMPLCEVETFIKEHRHLPEIPSEKTVLEEGINIAEMNALLLQKVEELTLYVIGLEKEIDKLKEKR